MRTASAVLMVSLIGAILSQSCGSDSLQDPGLRTVEPLPTLTAEEAATFDALLSEHHQEDYAPFNIHEGSERLGWSPLLSLGEEYSLDLARGYIEGYAEGTRIRNYYWIGGTDGRWILFVQGPRATLPEMPDVQEERVRIAGFDVRLFRSGTETSAMFETGEMAGSDEIFGFVYDGNGTKRVVERFIQTLEPAEEE